MKDVPLENSSWLAETPGAVRTAAVLPRSNRR